MAKNRQHQWEPVPGSEDLVKCKKCGTEVTTTRARQGAGPCTWGEKAEPDNPQQGIAPFNQQSPEAQALIADAAEAQEKLTPDELEEHARIMRETNLCDTCTQQIAECESNPKFGTGVGNDNVYECDGHTPPASPGVIDLAMIKPSKYPGPKLTDPPEYCNACGDHIAILPLNSRIDMVACNNRRCTLYRERLRTVTKPVERGKRKRAKG